MYEDLNRKAVAARDAFKSTVDRANNAVFSTASLAALLLIAGGLQGPLGKAGPWVVGAIGLLGVISGGLAAMWLSQTRGGDLAKKWCDARAKAEAKRLAYFKAIMQGASDGPLDELLALEYARRFLLTNQIDYFRDRGGEHESAAHKALKKSTGAVFVASTLTRLSHAPPAHLANRFAASGFVLPHRITRDMPWSSSSPGDPSITQSDPPECEISGLTAFAGLLSVMVPQLAVLAGLGVIASAYATLAVSRSAVNLDRTNADRYGSAEEQLKERELDIDTYRLKTASGDKGAVQEFFEPIFVTLEADHKGFLSDAEQRELAIGEMEKRLDAAKKKSGQEAAREADKGGC